jgi:hypothetical protein
MAIFSPPNRSIWLLKYPELISNLKEYLRKKRIEMNNPKTIFRKEFEVPRKKRSFFGY